MNIAYSTKEIGDRIKLIAKDQDIQIKEMLSDLGLGINTISNLTNGTGTSYLDFVRIADYLGCSTDYLLGRSNIKGVHFASGIESTSTTTDITQLLSAEQEALLLFRKLNDKQQQRIIGQMEYIISENEDSQMKEA